MKIYRQHLPVAAPIWRHARRIVANLASRRDAVKVKRYPLFHRRLKVLRLIQIELGCGEFAARNGARDELQDGLADCGNCIGGRHEIQAVLSTIGPRLVSYCTMRCCSMCESVFAELGVMMIRVCTSGSFEVS